MDSLGKIRSPEALKLAEEIVRGNPRDIPLARHYSAFVSDSGEMPKQMWLPPSLKYDREEVLGFDSEDIIF